MKQFNPQNTAHFTYQFFLTLAWPPSNEFSYTISGVLIYQLKEFIIAKQIYWGWDIILMKYIFGYEICKKSYVLIFTLFHSEVLKNF